MDKKLLVSAALLLTGCEALAPKPTASDGETTTYHPPIPYRTDHQDWPHIATPFPPDPALEARIESILERMTLEQKVGQMVQGEIHSVTPLDAELYHLGSILNGGGSWPGKNKVASLDEWLKLADAYWHASMKSGSEGTAIPILWGTDAVHGHNNVYGATLFPHNIGLGAANDPDLIARIARATAKQIRATGQDWTFSPTVAVARDDRWGRSYESYAEDPRTVFNYAGAYVKAIQGDFGADHVIATAKHFVGDGGTEFGTDQGNTKLSEVELINLHAQGYFSALAEGVQAVMISFSSWNGDKVHGSGYLVNDVLKQKLGFEGIVISDWNGHAQVPGCRVDRCPQAINAGIDMVMVPNDWRAFIRNTVRDVEKGDIQIARIDDAVRRILRVKLRAGLFDTPKPSERKLAGDADAIHGDAVKALAREAVRKSAVLLKNEQQTLPLQPSANLMVVGFSADNIPNQVGGWSLTWQGTNNSNRDFPEATSILSGIRQAVRAAGGNVGYSANGGRVHNDLDAIIAVIGETPYAEGNGDISAYASLDYRLRDSMNDGLFARLAERAPDVPIITLYVGGRPLWMNPQMNASDAFVAAWLPGTEGGGLADLLFGVHDFTGTLPFSWPAGACDAPLNRGDTLQPAFAVGYGLSFTREQHVPVLNEDAPPANCLLDGTAGDHIPELTLFSQGNVAPASRLSMVSLTQNNAEINLQTDPSLQQQLPADNSQPAVATASVVDGTSQYSALAVRSTLPLYIGVSAKEPIDLSVYAEAKTVIRFNLAVEHLPDEGDLKLAMALSPSNRVTMSLRRQIENAEAGQWQTMEVPLHCLTQAPLAQVVVPFGLLAYGDEVRFAFDNVSWVAQIEDLPDCDAFAPMEPFMP